MIDFIGLALFDLELFCTSAFLFYFIASFGSTPSYIFKSSFLASGCIRKNCSPIFSLIIHVSSFHVSTM
jgi:hypothetical protein